MRKNVLILGQNNRLETFVALCLKEAGCKVKTLTDIQSTKLIDFLKAESIDVVLINLFRRRRTILRDLDLIAACDIRKVVAFEDAYDVYLNSKNKQPFSVFEPLKPRNERCKEYITIEESISDRFDEFVVFRTSQIYGPHVDSGIINDLFTKKRISLENGLHDFLYEGDFIHAVEIGLRRDVVGFFDVVSGKSVDLKRTVVPLANEFRNRNLLVRWRDGKSNFVSGCENFRFYKWEPLVSLRTGFRVISQTTHL